MQRLYFKYVAQVILADPASLFKSFTYGLVFLGRLSTRVLAMTRLFGTALGLACLSAMVACGKGSTLPPAPVSTATPVAIVSSAPVSVATQVPVVLPASSSGATPMPVPLPTAAGFTPAMQLPLPNLATNAQLTVAVSNVQPAGIPTLSLGRAVQSKRTARSLGDSTVLLFTKLFFSSTVALPSAPGFTFDCPPADIIGSASYYIAFYDPTRPSLGWQLAFEGPATIAGAHVSFAPNPATLTFAANVAYYFALIAIPQSVSQPTAAPSVAPTTVPTQAPPLVAQAARPADAFVDAIGVNVHLHYDTTAYVTAYPQVRSMLVGSGIRHIRDGLIDTTFQTYYDHLTDLATAGIHSDLITAVGQSAALITGYPARVPQSIESIEGPNEYDLSNDANYAANLAAFQKTLYTTVKGSTATAGFSVIAPSLTSEAAFGAVGDLSKYADFGNIRDYFSGFNPGTNGYGAADSFGTFGSLNFGIAIARQESGAKPIVATEAGYQDGTGYPDDVPPAVKARYTQRTLLEGWNAGLARMYLYELLDEGADGSSNSFGLLDKSANPKPAYTALKNLIGALADPGASFVPAPLQVGISADYSVHHTLLEKRDGTYVLAVWVEAPSWNPNAKSAIAVSPQSFAIALSAPPTTIGAVSFDDSGNFVPISPTSSTTTTFTYNVSDNVMLISIK